MDLDVVVTDRDGRPVRDLKRGDFTVRLGGKVVPIDYFARVDAGAIQAPDLATASPEQVITAPGEAEPAFLPRHFLTDPASALTFLPQGSGRTASAEVYIAAMDDEGRTSEIARQDTTFALPAGGDEIAPLVHLDGTPDAEGKPSNRGQRPR